MLLRRITEHLKEQNWIAIGLDLIVVVVGLFLAFQIDRWYQDQQIKSSQVEHFEALAVDFEASRFSLERDIGLHLDAIDASLILLAYDEESAEDLSNDDFYDLMRRVQYMGNWSPQTRAYDVLVFSGQIDVIEDDELKSDLAAYYASAARAQDRRGEMIMQRVTMFEPFMNDHLDHAALVYKVHPDISETEVSSMPPEQFRNVLGTHKFEGVIATKMHGSRDATGYLGRLMDLNLEIEERLAKLPQAEPVQQNNLE